MSENCYLFFSENCYCWVKLLFLSEDFKFYTKNIILTIKRKFILTIYKFTHNFWLGWWIFKIQKLTWSSEWDHSKYWCPVKFYSVLRLPTANRVLSAPLGAVRQAEKNLCPEVILLKGLSVLWDFHCVLLYFEWDHSKYWCPVKFYSVMRMPTANRVLSAPLGPVRQAEKNVCPAVILLKGLSVLWDFHCVLLYFEWDHSKYLCPVMFYSVQWWGREGGGRESE